MLLKEIVQTKGFKRVSILAILTLALFGLKSILGLLLITFIFTFLMDRIQSFLLKVTRKILPINQRLLIVILYLTVTSALILGMIKFVPIIIVEITQLIRQITYFYQQPQNNEVITYIIEAISVIELTNYLEQGFAVLYKSIANISKWGLQILLALILSLFFLIEKQRVARFASRFKQSNLSFVFTELEFFGKRFVRSFGKVIEVQFLIAIINCILSVIALWILDFPQLFALGLMIFILGLIPVAGVIISLFPLCIIAFSIGGVTKVIYILITITIIHVIEGYFLNPKLMSNKTDLPVFFTFIVLILCQHFFGVWGLITGIPLFIFLLDLLGIEDENKKLHPKSSS